MIKNTYKAPVGVWSKFKSDEAKKIYNGVMKQSLTNQPQTIHPETEAIPLEQWKTICHNMACYAAWSLEKPKKIVEIK